MREYGSELRAAMVPVSLMVELMRLDSEAGVRALMVRLREEILTRGIARMLLMRRAATDLARAPLGPFATAYIADLAELSREFDAAVLRRDRAASAIRELRPQWRDAVLDELEHDGGWDPERHPIPPVVPAYTPAG